MPACENVAGASLVSAGTRMWAVMIDLVPASIAAANGGRSRSCSNSTDASTVGSSRWESATVAPWPGKCLAQAATPACWSPSTAAAAWAATSFGSAPKLRVPMMGLSSAVLTSTVGARSRLIPASSSSAPIAR